MSTILQICLVHISVFMMARQTQRQHSSYLNHFQYYSPVGLCRREDLREDVSVVR